MQKRPHLALMASSLIAIFLCFFFAPKIQAEARSSSAKEVITTSTDENGHTVYVSESVAAPSRHSQALKTRQNSLVFWSVTEHKWKPVPAANIRAARSAAAEVDEHFSPGLSPVETAASEKDVSAAIEEAAARHDVDP